MVSAKAALVAKIVAAAMQASLTVAPFRTRPESEQNLDAERLCDGESAGTPAWSD
jgi:hypothetical protein